MWTLVPTLSATARRGIGDGLHIDEIRRWTVVRRFTTVHLLEKETQCKSKRDLQKRPTHSADVLLTPIPGGGGGEGEKERERERERSLLSSLSAYYRCKRDLLQKQKRPTVGAKEA